MFLIDFRRILKSKSNHLQLTLLQVLVFCKLQSITKQIIIPPLQYPLLSPLKHTKSNIKP